MDKRLEIYFDENLKDVSKDPEGLKSYVTELEQSLITVTDLLQRVQFLGKLGVHLRILGSLQEAEQKLKEALQLVRDHNLGIMWEIVQKIRLAHVLQWKRDFNSSDLLFREILTTCRSNSEAGVYLDFALQHAGKNFFDQNKLNEALVFFEEALSIRTSKQSPQDQIDSTLFAIKRTKTLLNE